MIICHDFGISINEYEVRGKQNDFPIIECCFNCKEHGKVQRHGFYWRYGICEEGTLNLPICRMKCMACDKTFSILPDFLIPYFQHTLHTIIFGVEHVLEGKQNKTKRQVMASHLKRFLMTLNWIHTFFADQGDVLDFSEDIKKEAKKYLKMILDFGESPFLRRSWGHLTKHFMAL